MPEIIQFDDPVLLIGGGDLDAELVQRFTSMPVVAVDGGANHLSEANNSLQDITPELILGDLDSLENKVHWQSKTKVVEITEQDTTDFEKCLYSVAAPYYIAMGFSGGRLDHSLAALHVMQKHCDQKRVVLISERDVLLVTSKPITLQLPTQTRVSVYPLPEVTFESSEGLQYPLDGLKLKQGEAIGTSNQSSAERVVMNPHSGVYAVILPLEHLSAVINWLA